MSLPTKIELDFQPDPLCLDTEIGGSLESINEADLFKYFLNEDIHDTKLDDDSLQSSPHSSPSQLSPDSPPFASTSTVTPPPPMFEPSESIFKKTDVSIKMEANETRKRERGGEKIGIPLSREEMLKITSKDLENFTQVISSNRTLSSEEERQLKRQRRLIKNRESAQLSRLRKKMYIEDLERKLTSLTAQNETLTKQVAAVQADKKKLAEEVAYLQSIIKQSPQLSSAVANGRKSSPPKGVKTAGLCLLIVLFSFGLFFNVSPNRSSTNNQASNSLSPSVPSVYTGRVLRSMDAQQNESKSNVESSKKHTLDQSEKSADSKRKKMRISDTTSSAPNKHSELVPFSSSSIHKETNNTSYIYCPQAQEVRPAAGGQDPDVVALLVPSSIFNRTLLANHEFAVDSSLLEVSCQVLNLRLWPLESHSASNSTN